MSSDNRKILFDPFEKQMEFIEAVLSDEYKIIGYGGAIRGGKTIGGLGTLILLCKIFPGSRWAVIRETLPQIKKNVIPKLDEVLPQSFIKTMPSQHNVHTLTMTNESQIVFHAENFDSNLKYLEDFKGMEVDGFLFDEVSGINEKTFNKALERLGTWKMRERKEERESGKRTPPNVVMFTCNPTQNWVKKRFYDKYINNTLPENVLYIPSKVYDNPHITQEWIDTQKATMNSLDYAMMMDGDWEVNLNEHPFFYTFDEHRHISEKPLEWDEYEPLWLVFDFNIQPCTCTIFQDKEESGFVALKEHLVDGGTRELCNELEPRYADWPGGINVAGDVSGNAGRSSAIQTDFEIIEEVMGLNSGDFVLTRKANERHKRSRKVCAEFFHKVPFLIDKDGCPNLIADLKKAKPDTQGKLFKNRDKGHAMDSGDTMRYFVSARFRKGDVTGGIASIRRLVDLYEWDYNNSVRSAA